MTTPKIKVTIYLIKETYNELSQFIKHGSYKAVDVDLGEGMESTLIYQGGFQSIPPWVRIFEDVPGFERTGIFNQYSKALLAVKYEGRWFCFTFGHSRHLIDDLAIVRNFGLIVTLNRSDPEMIRSIDKTNLGHIALNSREQATKEIEFSGFEFDNDIDLLKAITGKTHQDGHGERDTYTGKDSVGVYSKVGLSDFSDLVKSIYKSYHQTDYKKNYPWIDKITEERDREAIGELDALLANEITAKNFHRVWLAIPEPIEWENLSGFTFMPPNPRRNAKAGPVLLYDLDLNDAINQCTFRTGFTTEALKRRSVWTVWKDGRPPASWNFYRCLNAELELRGQTYILNDGSWYQIDRDYVREIDDFFSNVPEAELSLPRYGTSKEPEYLQKFRGDDNWAVMDNDPIMIGGGRSRVEFCDLYSRTGDIVHVKKYGGSSLLSHLFNQALVSGDAFLWDKEFRKKVNEKLPKRFRIPNTDQAPEPKDYSICLAIMSKEPGELRLPFFSRVSFKHAVTRLRRMGYGVVKYKIEQ